MTKTQKIICWIATLWRALDMVSTGAVKILKVKAGAVAALVPKFPLVKEWAYAGLFFAMTGAIFSHVASGDSLNEILPLILLLTLTLVSWYFRPAGRKLVSVNPQVTHELQG